MVAITTPFREGRPFTARSAHAKTRAAGPRSHAPRAEASASARSALRENPHARRLARRRRPRRGSTMSRTQSGGAHAAAKAQLARGTWKRVGR